MLSTNPHLIKVSAKFESVYNKHSEVLESMIVSMKKKGFDASTPLVIWKEKNILIDGHTRLRAAIAAGLPSVPYVLVSLPDEKSVFEYMEHVQLDRRNLTDADKVKILLKDQNFAAASNKKEYIAEKFRCSPRTAVKYMNILKYPKEVERMLKGNDDEPKEKAEPKQSTDLYLTHAKRLLKTLPGIPDNEGRKVLRELHLKIGRVLRSN